MAHPGATPLPQLFKGIALFTPGGDVVYCIDPEKQGRWHLHLCTFLQDLLGLTEPPHFLVPCYTATLDRWLDLRDQSLHLAAEACRPVLRYQGLLNLIFQTGSLRWQPTPWDDGLCDPLLLATYIEQFPQLWESHNLVAQLTTPSGQETQLSRYLPPETVLEANPRYETQGYVLRLFVSGQGPATERTLYKLHTLLETQLPAPYTLKVIDIFKYPDQAEANQVLATPTLLKVWPRPVRRIVGDMEDQATILRVLGATEEFD